MSPNLLTDDSEAPSITQSRERTFIGLVLIGTFALYAATLNFEFVYDDWPQIVRNPFLISWKQVASYYTSSVWDHIFPGNIGNFYRPVFMSWLALNRYVFGLNPFGWHLTTVLLHLVTTYLLYLVARRLFKDGFLAVLAAAIFGFHAVHVESVAWVSGVTDPLVAVFMLTSFLTFLNYRHTQKAAWLAISVLLYGVGLLSKETAIVLPVILLVFLWKEDRHPDTSGFWSSAARLYVYGLVTIGYFAARQFALGRFAHDDGRPIEYLAKVMPYVIAKYLQAMLMPVDLALFHDPPDIAGFASWKFVVPVLVIAGSAWCLWRLFRISSALAVAVSWMVLPLLPALAGVMLLERDEFVHDRYLYLPSVGFAMLLAWGLRHLRPNSRRVFGTPIAQLTGVLMLVTFYGTAAALQIRPWESNLLLYSHGVKSTKCSVIARDHLATELLAKNDPENALYYFRQALQIDPSDWRTAFALGVASYHAHRPADADRYLTMAAGLQPGNSNQYYYRGLARMEMGQLNAAEEDLTKAISITDFSADYYRALGILKERVGDVPEAVKQYQLALKLGADSALEQHLRSLQSRLTSQ